MGAVVVVFVVAFALGGGSSPAAVCGMSRSLLAETRLMRRARNSFMHSCKLNELVEPDSAESSSSSSSSSPTSSSFSSYSSSISGSLGYFGPAKV